jgi:WD40 repeat protein
MTGIEALSIIDLLLKKNQQLKLKDAQRELLLQVWAGHSYQEIAEKLGYEPEYIRQLASQLWKSLSRIVGEKISKGNIKSILSQYHSSHAFSWEDAVDVSQFYGRVNELQVLQNWILNNRCKLVGLFGLGGVGKTSLSVKISQQIASNFQYLVWRSLRNAPTPQDLLNEILPILVGSEVQEASIKLLMNQLRQKTCLIILDNVEPILQPGKYGGKYLPGYEAYGEIFDLIADTSHQSCLILTSREKPNGIATREGVNSPVRSIQLGGLSVEAAQNILSDKGITTEDHQKTLVDYFHGNPLALKIAATSVQRLFAGNVQSFLAQGTTIFGNLWELLDQQFDRLSNLEQQVMYWLAINRESIIPSRLQAKFVPSVTMPQLLEALEALWNKALIETTNQGLTQQPVIMEYITERLLSVVQQEIISGETSLLKTHALIEAATKDYLREVQIQMILQPLVKKLFSCFASQVQLEQHLFQVLNGLRYQSPEQAGYSGGNILNLFCCLRTDLTGFDFSHLAIRQAYLLNTTLHNADFTESYINQSVFARTFGGVPGLAYSRDGKYLATGDMKGDIQIWDSISGEQQICLNNHHWIWAVNFSPDGRYLASASYDPLVRLWDIERGECTYTYSGHTQSVNAVVFSPDGQIIASASFVGDSIHLWRDFADNSNPNVQVLGGHTGGIRSIAFSPDSKTLVSGSEDCSIRLWNVVKGECYDTWQAHDSWVRSVVFSPDGQLIATAGHDCTIKIWKIANQECLLKLSGHQEPITSIDFSPDGNQLVSASNDRTIKLWSVCTGECLKTLLGHQGIVWNVAFHPNGELIASSGDDRSTKIWDLQEGRCINTMTGHANAVLSLNISPNGLYLASGYEDANIRVWEIATGRLIKKTIQGHTGRIWSVIFSPDGRFIVSGSADYQIKLWDWQQEKCLQTFTGHNSWVWKVIFSSDGSKLASSSYDRTVKLWSVATGECLQTLGGHQTSVGYVAFSPNGELLASSDFDGTIKIWNVDSGECQHSFPAHPDSTVWSVEFSADGQWLLSASNDRTIRLWSLLTGECLQTFQGHQDTVVRAKFSTDNQLIVSGGFDRTLKVWDVQTGKCLKTLDGHHGIIYDLDVANISCLAGKPHQLLAFSASLDEAIKVWNIETGECLDTWKTLRPYEGMKIDRLQGLTKAQKSTLLSLGAVTSGSSS